QPLPHYQEKKLRFNWNTPIHISATQQGTVYIGAQVLFRSKDYGQTWERISPDLTTNDPQKQKQEQSGGITVDNSAAEMHTTFDLHTFGDMRPYAYKSTDFGATWTPLVAPDSPVRGYAHVIKEDLVNANLLFLGTELGLWVSVDGGKQWAHYKGGDLPAVAVRDLAIHP